MINKISIFFLAALAFIPSSSDAASRITLTADMFSLGPGSTGNPALFADEQALVGDPLAGDTSDPVNTWLSTNGVHLNIAYLDLGASHQLTHIAYYDRNGTADFRIYDDATGALLVQDDLVPYMVWKIRALDVDTRRLRFENSTGFGRVPEIVLYGDSGPGADGGPALGEFKVTAHTTEDHRNFACNLATCDRIITSITGQVVLSSSGTSPVAPGDLVCLQPGATPFTGRLKLLDIRGTAEEPVEITNCGGQVVFEGGTSPILAERSVHFKILGNGHQSALYGIKVVNAGNDALKVRYLSRNFEIGWIQFDGNRGTAVKAKSEQKGADLVTGQPFVQKGTHIHHLRSNNTVEHEGFYIGATSCNPETALETWPDAPLEDVSVHDNIVLDSGADGFQVGCASGDVRIYNNYVKTAGYRPFSGDLQQRHGIQVAAVSTGRVYQNWVEDTASTCIHASGGHPDGLQIYNNVLKGCPEAVYFNQSLQFSGEVVVANNTILTSTPHGFRGSGWHRERNNPTFKIYNNLFVGTTAETVFLYDDRTAGEPLTTLKTLQADDQLYYANVSQPGFVDGAGADYRLMSDSPARDVGTNTANFGVLTDLRGVTRDTAYDVGALEYVP